MLYAGEQVFDDSNYEPLRGDGKRVTFNGETFNLSYQMPTAADVRKGLLCTTPFAAAFKLIPRSDWSAMLKEQIRLKARFSDHCKFPAYSQNGTNYCWINGPAQVMTAQRLRQGLPLRILSAASGGCLIKNYRNVGGNELPAIEWISRNGLCTVDKWPNAAIDRRYDTDQTRRDRVHYKATEWISCRGFDEFATCCLLGMGGAIAYYWWMHVVTICDLVEIEPGHFGFRIRNSHGVNWGAKNEHGYAGFAVFAEGKGTPGSGVMLQQVTPSSGEWNQNQAGLYVPGDFYQSAA